MMVVIMTLDSAMMAIKTLSAPDRTILMIDLARVKAVLMIPAGKETEREKIAEHNNTMAIKVCVHSMVWMEVPTLKHYAQVFFLLFWHFVLIFEFA